VLSLPLKCLDATSRAHTHMRARAHMTARSHGRWCHVICELETHMPHAHIALAHSASPGAQMKTNTTPARALSCPWRALQVATSGPHAPCSRVLVLRVCECLEASFAPQTERGVTLLVRLRNCQRTTMRALQSSPTAAPLPRNRRRCRVATASASHALPQVPYDTGGMAAATGATARPCKLVPSSEHGS